MTSCTSIHTESIVIIWSIKPEGKKVVYHAHSTEEDFRNSFIGSNQLSPIVKISGRIVPKSGLSDHANTLFKTVVESYGIRVPIQAISMGST